MTKKKRGRVSRVIDGERCCAFSRLRGGEVRLSSSTETTEAEAWESKVAWKWELTSEWDSWGVKGGLDYDSSNSWWSQTLAACPVGKVVQQVEAALLGTVHRCHQQVPCNEGRQGQGGLGWRGVTSYQFQVKERARARWTLNLGTGRGNRARERQEIQSGLTARFLQLYDADEEGSRVREPENRNRNVNRQSDQAAD